MRYLIIINFIFCQSFICLSQSCDSLIQIGDEYYSNFEFDKAIVFYFECQRLNPDNYQANFKCASAYYQLQNYPEAILYFQAASLIDNSQPLPLYYLYKSYKANGELNASLEYVKKLVDKNSDNYSFRLDLAKEYALRGQTINAIEEYWILLQSKPNNGYVIENLAKEYYKLEGFDTADSLISIGYRSPTNRTVSYLQTMSKIKYKLGEDSLVVSLVDQVNEKKDSTLYFMKLKAASLNNLKDYNRCISVAKWIENEMKPKRDEFIHYMLAEAYLGLEVPDSALLHLNFAIEAGLSPNLPKYYSMSGKIYQEEDKIPQAIEAYQDVLRYEENANALYLLGVLSDQYYADKNIALRYFQKYLKESRSADSEYARYAKSRIAVIKEILHQSQ